MCWLWLFVLSVFLFCPIVCPVLVFNAFVRFTIIGTELLGSVCAFDGKCLGVLEYYNLELLVKFTGTLWKTILWSVCALIYS